MKKSIYILLLACATFVGSCSDDTEDPDTDNSSLEPTEQLVTKQTGCKPVASRQQVQETVQLKTINKNQLLLKHIDATLNCRPGNIYFLASLSNNQITITEREEDTSANCVCLYDLDYTITLPAYGKYSLRINGADFGEFEFSAKTDVTLVKYMTPSSNDPI